MNQPVVDIADPATDSAWHQTVIDEDDLITSLACPTSTLCVATDAAGDIAVSGDPGDVAPRWQLEHIDSPVPVPVPAGYRVHEHWLQSISCPSTALCVAVDYAGQVLWSTDPLGGSSTWHAAAIDPGHEFSLVACAPNTSMCVAGDADGRIFVTPAAQEGASAWVSRSISGTRQGFEGLACPTVSFCLAVDFDNNAFSSTDPPTLRPGSPQAVFPTHRTNGPLHTPGDSRARQLIRRARQTAFSTA